MANTIRVYEEVNTGFWSGDKYTTQYQEITEVTNHEIQNLLALPWIKIQENVWNLEGKVIILNSYEASLLREQIKNRVEKIVREKIAA